MIRATVKAFRMILLAGLVLLSAYTLATAEDSCLYIYPNTVGHYVNQNIDSVARDTCSLSATHNHLYSKRYELHFKVNAFHLGYASPDSILIVHWEDIDTLFPVLRNSFNSIYSRVGAFYFQKMRPQDTSFSYDGFKMIFNEYFPVETVLAELDTIWTNTGIMEAGFNPPRDPATYVHQEKTVPLELLIHPNPSMSKVIIQRSDGKNIDRISMFDTNGKEVFNLGFLHHTEVTLDLRTFPNGSYTIVCDNLSPQTIINNK